MEPDDLSHALVDPSQAPEFVECFSSDAAVAKTRFLAAATRVHAQHISLLPESETPDLTMDAAILGEAGLPTLFVSSGVHGLELLFGSAVQLALLQAYEDHPEAFEGIRLVLLHAVNPFGGHNLRRFDATNIDLNRNFLKDGERYEGSPAAYDRLVAFFNPPGPPNPWEPIWLKLPVIIARYGLAGLKQALGGGQYQHPKGIFFGGHGPSMAMVVLEQSIDDLIGDAPSVTHLDLHTGLGAFGACAMLVDRAPEHPDGKWCQDVFGAEVTQFLKGESVAYEVRGSFGAWMQERYKDRPYRFAAAEFGTYSPIRVFKALRAENQAHQFADPLSPALEQAKNEALECFVPKDRDWRVTTVSTCLDMVGRALRKMVQEREQTWGQGQLSSNREF